MALPINQPSMVSDPQADLEELAKTLKGSDENDPIKKISLHIDKVWAENQKENKPIRLEMVNLMRKSRGEYDPVKLQAIKAFKGSETYIRSAEAKCRAADSWLKDIYRGDSDLPWILEPTAEPELPDETVEEIRTRTQQYAAQAEQEVIASGAMMDKEQIADLLNKYYGEQLDKAKQNIIDIATERCLRAATVIRDQNQEGGWSTAFKDFLWYFIRLKAGIIKGPSLVKKPKQTWTVSEDGSYELTTIDTLVHDVYAVSPFNFYPSKGMKHVNDGDIIELYELSKQSIASLIGVPNYSEEEIKKVLAKYSKGELKAKWINVEDATVVKQVTTNKNNFYPTTPVTQNSTETSSDLIDAMEYWGTISGQYLIEWGMEGDIKPEEQYQVSCIKIGEHVIKAVVNPDSLGRKPYHVTSWAKNPEWIWGEGLLEFAAPVEDAQNATGRALINNVAIASGPMCELDRDRVDMKQPIYPWRQIESTSMQMRNEGPAVNYYQPQMHAQELMQVWQFWGKVLDEMTVPAYAQGASQSGVTAGTATVFTQLLAAATRSLKASAANIDDDVISPYIQMCYDYLMKLTEDVTLKGDARAVAKGVSGLLAKEQQAQRKVEFLQVAANPTYQQILGRENIGAILAQIAKSQEINLPDTKSMTGRDDSAEAIIQQMLLAQAGVDSSPQPTDPMQANGQMANGGGAPTSPQGTNADGSKAGVNNAA